MQKRVTTDQNPMTEEERTIESSLFLKLGSLYSDGE